MQSPFLDDCTALFLELRQAGLLKRPGSAELIYWIHWLKSQGFARGHRTEKLSNEEKETFVNSLSVLVKNRPDLDVAHKFMAGKINYAPRKN